MAKKIYKSMQEWKDRNREHIKRYNKRYKEKNREKIREKEKEWKERNKDKIRAYYKTRQDNLSPEQIIKSKISAKKSREKNKDKKKVTDKQYQEKNKTRIAKQKKEYYEINKKKIIKQHGIYNKLKNRNDISYNIKVRLRSRLNKAKNGIMKNRKYMKSDDFGIDYEKIMNHLKPFPENISKYHIDHIKPLCSFDLCRKSQVKKAFSPKNHQWLLASDNLSKIKYDKQISFNKITTKADDKSFNSGMEQIYG